MATTPILTPAKMEPKEEAEQMEKEEASTPGTSGEFIEKPIHISVGGKTKMLKFNTKLTNIKDRSFPLPQNPPLVHKNS